MDPLHWSFVALFFLGFGILLWLAYVERKERRERPHRDDRVMALWFAERAKTTRRVK